MRLLTHPIRLKEIDADTIYSSLHAAHLLGLRGGTEKAQMNAVNRLGIRSIPLGPKGGRRGYVGRDILTYLYGESTQAG